MTQEEIKARELVEKFMKDEFIEVDSKQGDFLRHMTLGEAKQCALIAVDEIIEEIRDYCDYNHHLDRMNYWQQVKESIKTIEI